MSQDKKSFIIHTQADWNNFVNLVRPFIAKKTFKVTADSDYKKRTEKQNPYLHVLFSTIANLYKEKYPDEADKDKFTMEYWKDYCKNNWGLRAVRFDLEDNPFLKARSTRSYSKTEMTNFIEKIRAEVKKHPKLQFNLLSPDEWREKMGYKDKTK